MRCRFGEQAISVKLPILISQSVLGMLLLVVSISALAETAFTYQGRLSQSGEPANGIYDMRFNLFDAVTAGSLIGPTVNQTGVKVLDGVFNVMLDFGDSPFAIETLAVAEASLQCRMVNDQPSVPEEYFATVYCIDNP